MGKLRGGGGTPSPVVGESVELVLARLNWAGVGTTEGQAMTGWVAGTAGCSMAQHSQEGPPIPHGKPLLYLLSILLLP